MLNLGISEDQELGGVPDDEMLIDVDFDEEMEHSYLDRFLGILPSVEWRKPVEEGVILLTMRRVRWGKQGKRRLLCLSPDWRIRLKPN